MTKPSTAELPGVRELARRGIDLRRWIGRQIVELRTDAGVSQAQLARCAEIPQSFLWRIEAGRTQASADTLLRVGACLGADLSVRFFPGSGPRLHDRFQAPIIEALLRISRSGWRAAPEVPV